MKGLLKRKPAQAEDDLMAPPTDDEALMAAPSEDEMGDDLMAPPTEDELSEGFSDLSVDGLIEGTLSLPSTAGAMAGGLLRNVPGAGIPMATGAGIAGKSLEHGIRRLLGRGGPQTRTQQYQELMEAGASAAGGEAAGHYLTKGLGKLSEIIKPAQKENAGLIADATKRLGAKPTTGQLSASPTLRGLESSLEQSPSLSGALTRRETGPVREAITDSMENVFSGATPLQPSETGSLVKEGIKSRLASRAAPLSESFDNIRASTEFIDVRPKSAEGVARNLEREFGRFPDLPDSKLASQISGSIRAIKTADDIKELKTRVGRMMNSALDGSPEMSVLNSTYKKLSNMEERSIIRSALESASNKKQGKEIAKGLMNELKGARAGWKKIFEDVGDIGKGSGVAKGDVNNVDYFFSKLDQIPDEKVADTLFKLGNRKYLQKFKEVFPQEFDMLKDARLRSIRDKATTKNGLSPRMFLNEIKGLEPKTKDLLFGEKAAQVVDDIETVVNSLPDKIGPSGSPQGIEFLDFNLLNPANYLRELGRASQYGILKAPNAPSQAIGRLGQQKNAPLYKGLIQRQLERE